LKDGWTNYPREMLRCEDHYGDQDDKVEKNEAENFCLNICVLVRHESMVATPDPSFWSKPLFAKGLAKDKLGGVW
jgi:hypothetical protein